MFGKFSEEAQKILVEAKREMNELNHPYVGSEHLLLAILNQNNDLTKKLKKYNLTYKIFKDELINIVGVGTVKSEWYLYTPLLKRVLENAIIESKETEEEVSVQSLLLSLLNEGEGVAIRIMLGLSIDINKLYNEISNKKQIKSSSKKKLLISELAEDLTMKAKNNELDPVIGRDNELQRLIEVLSRRTKNNPILIGDAGVGKTAIVEELARLIVNNEVPKSLKNKKIFSLDMASAVAGTKYRGEFEERIKKIVKEVEDNDDIILFIDEIHTLVGAGGAEGAIDASNIFKPSLARGKMRCIGATTINEYKEFIEKDNALDRRFQKVYIDEPNNENLKNILMKLKGIYEGYHGVKINENIIDKIMELSKRYIYDRCEPDKSIDILDEVCAKVSLKEVKEEVQIRKYYDELENVKKEKNKSIINQNYDKAYSLREKEEDIESKINELEMIILEKKKRRKVTINDVIEVVNMKTKIPVYELNNDINKQIEVMKNNLRENIIGQNSAIDKLLEITKKIKLGIKDSNKSYSLLFCGPSGVGKTYLSRVYAKNLVGEKNIIKLDMSEYTDSASINKLIGSPAGYVGYNDNKNILEKIRVKPYSVLILDEIEKAHPSILNFFLNILDEGNCTDSNGRVIRFDNVVIIMTSNAEVSKNLVGFNNTNNEQLKEYFSKEFLNRIDEVVEFKSLTLDTINQIIIKEIKKYSEKYNKENIISIDMVNDIISESNYKDFGARKLCKIVRKKIENEIIYNMS